MLSWIFIALILTLSSHFAESAQEPSVIRFVSAGDVFPSPSLIECGTGPNSNRNYDPYFTQVKPILADADFATVWFGGPIASPGEAFSGYPLYNNPPELATAARNAGFSIFFHTNHLLDQGIQGLIRSVQFFKKNGIHQLGMFEDEKESKEIFIVKKNNIRIAILSYLYGSNMDIDHPSWMVNYIHTNQIRKDIVRAKELNSDFVIVAIHWGTEYQRNPDSFQLSTARAIASYGADMILGSHPHMIQPADELITTNASGFIRKTFVIYSMGNFLHTMLKRYTDSGLLLRYKIEKNPKTGKTKLSRTSYIPVWLQWHQNPADGRYQIRVIPTKKFMELYERGQTNGMTPFDFERMKQSWDDTIALLDNPKIGLMHEK